MYAGVFQVSAKCLCFGSYSHNIFRYVSVSTTQPSGDSTNYKLLSSNLVQVWFSWITLVC